MVRVGVTGGIGSGKSTVCSTWEEMGAVVVYADELAKRLMVEDEVLAASIRSAFGARAYLADGSLDRKYLAEEAFSRERVGELNSLVHPVVKKKVAELMEAAGERGAPLFAEEAALLLAAGRPAWCDYVVLVTAEKRLRIERVRHRDSAGEEEVIARMSRQQSSGELRPLCDYILENNGGIEELKRKSAALYHKMTECRPDDRSG